VKNTDLPGRRSRVGVDSSYPDEGVQDASLRRRWIPVAVDGYGFPDKPRTRGPRDRDAYYPSNLSPWHGCPAEL